MLQHLYDGWRCCLLNQPFRVRNHASDEVLECHLECRDTVKQGAAGGGGSLIDRLPKELMAKRFLLIGDE